MLISICRCGRPKKSEFDECARCYYAGREMAAYANGKAKGRREGFEAGWSAGFDAGVAAAAAAPAAGRYRTHQENYMNDEHSESRTHAPHGREPIGFNSGSDG